MSASDYPINYPYGATDAPYSASHPHRGDDRACPTGTPIVINGITIGLTGATGMVTGPHLHIQEWSTSYADTRKPQNAFVGGTVVDLGTLSEFGNFITILTGDNWHDTYCHLSQINVTKGQLITEGNSMYQIRAIPADIVRQHYANYTNGHVQLSASDPACQGRTEFTEGSLGGEFWRGLNSHQLSIIQSLDAKIAELEAQGTGQFVKAGDLYIKK